jgi:hypothetical protein
MRPDPVWKRILRALELGPMTRHQLCVCLDTCRGHMQNELAYLKNNRAVKIVGKVTNRKTKPDILYGLVL